MQWVVRKVHRHHGYRGYRPPHKTIRKRLKENEEVEHLWIKLKYGGKTEKNELCGVREAQKTLARARKIFQDSKQLRT